VKHPAAFSHAAAGGPLVAGLNPPHAGAAGEDARTVHDLTTECDDAALRALMAQCTRGDTRAFAELYGRTGARLYGVAVGIVRRRDWAEDVLQESYLNIWMHLRDYRATTSAPLTWMTAIVRNRALDWVRRPNLEQGQEGYDEFVESLPGGEPQPDQALEASRDGRALAAYLQRLSGNERQALVLAYARGLSHRELAWHLNQPIGTVKTWIRRGLHKLKGRLQERA
jgi:RNA polymerase sigma-70 factor (ECF subfamily)